MGQNQTNKYAKEIHILKQIIKQIENGDIAPSISGQISKGTLKTTFTVLYSNRIIDHYYRIDIEENDLKIKQVEK